MLRLTFYVTRWAPEKTGGFMTGVEAVAEETGLPAPLPWASLIGVEYLFEPAVEVEAAAVLDRPRRPLRGGRPLPLCARS